MVYWHPIIADTLYIDMSQQSLITPCWQQNHISDIHSTPKPGLVVQTSPNRTLPPPPTQPNSTLSQASIMRQIGALLPSPHSANNGQTTYSKQGEREERECAIAGDVCRYVIYTSYSILFPTHLRWEIQTYWVNTFPTR
jgi:hypothetical protein